MNIPNSEYHEIDSAYGHDGFLLELDQISAILNSINPSNSKKNISKWISLKVGLFGFGCVGQGLYEIIERENLPIELTAICVKDPEKVQNTGGRSL